MAPLGLLSLPQDILFLLPEYLHNIEDLVNTASTCRGMRSVMATAKPNTVLRLAEAQSRIFFRPSPHFLVTAVARQLGNWARKSHANERELVLRMQEDGIDGLLDLALIHCGLTLERIRELHQLRFSLINPVEDIIDKCVGKQWYSIPDFWSGGAEDAYTISSEPSETLFHLAMYGELFAPDFEPILNNSDSRDLDADATPRLSVETRLEFIKYCLPDFACFQNGLIGALDATLPNGQLDPRRDVKPTGPYAPDAYGGTPHTANNNLALTWVIRSTRFRPAYAALRARAGAADFQADFEDEWWYDGGAEQSWRQRFWENVMVCQGLEGLGMMLPGVQDKWLGKVREWREQIARLDREPRATKVGRHTTLEYPYLLGDLRICASGYAAGT